MGGDRKPNIIESENVDNSHNKYSPKYLPDKHAIMFKLKMEKKANIEQKENKLLVCGLQHIPWQKLN